MPAGRCIKETPPDNPEMTDWEGSLAVICDKASVTHSTSVLRNVRVAVAFMLVTFNGAQSLACNSNITLLA